MYKYIQDADEVKEFMRVIEAGDKKTCVLTKKCQDRDMPRVHPLGRGSVHYRLDYVIASLFTVTSVS